MLFTLSLLLADTPFSLFDDDSHADYFFFAMPYAMPVTPLRLPQLPLIFHMPTMPLFDAADMLLILPYAIFDTIFHAMPMPCRCRFDAANTIFFFFRELSSFFFFR